MKTLLGVNCHESRLMSSDKARSYRYGLGSLYVPSPDEYRIRAITDFPMYSVDTMGVVRNIKTGKVIKGIDNGFGYLQVFIKHSDGEFYHKRVHRLVAEAFIKNPENKKDIDHINNDRSDNKLENIRWATRSENIQHAMNQNRMAVSNGAYKGIGHPQSKLTDKDVLEIKELLSKKELTQKEIAEMFGVTPSNISYIKLGRSWSHV